MFHVKDQPDKWATYLIKDHEKMITGHGDPIELIGGMFIEMACPPE